MDNGASSYLRFLNGDQNGYVEIIREYSNRFILFIDTIVDDIHLAEEIADDVFLKLYIDKPDYKETYSFKTWLYAIGRNTALDYLRKIKRHRYSPIEHSFYISDETNLESDFIVGEQNRLIHQCIKALNKEYADVLFLIYFEELSNTETAKVIGKSSRQVAQLLYCAKKALREEMERRTEL